VIARYAGSEILRRLNAARCRFDRYPGNGYLGSRPARICVQRFLPDIDALSRIGKENARLLHVGDHGDGFPLLGDAS
jgi:hypothetical protein